MVRIEKVVTFISRNFSGSHAAPGAIAVSLLVPHQLSVVWARHKHVAAGEAERRPVEFRMSRPDAKLTVDEASAITRLCYKNRKLWRLQAFVLWCPRRP